MTFCQFFTVGSSFFDLFLYFVSSIFLQAGEDEEVIYELRDDEGELYYFNGQTGVSSWDPPEWIDSIDPVTMKSGVKQTTQTPVVV